MSSATCGKVLLHLGRHVAGIDVIGDTENPTGQSNSVESSGDGNAMQSKMCQELVEILQIGVYGVHHLADRGLMHNIFPLVVNGL